jgi:hypothetical protein
MKIQQRMTYKVLLLLLLLGFSFTLSWKEPVYRNIAYLSFADAMGSKMIEASMRQAKLAQFLNFIQRTENISIPEDLRVDVSMPQALFIGEYNRYHGDLQAALKWYHVAVRAMAEPRWQSSLSHIPLNDLLPDGNLLINDLSDLERLELVEGDTNVADFTLKNNNGIVSISFDNDFDERDRLAYVLHTGDIPLAYHPVLTLRFKSSSGYLSLATLIDGDRQRQISYYQGDGDWEILSVPLEGDMLEKLYFKFDEPGESPQYVEVYKFWVDWIRLELPPAYSSR